jgi:hypothetical protein
MGFYVDISWESRCYIEINVWAGFDKILLVFEVHFHPRVKGMTVKDFGAIYSKTHVHYYSRRATRCGS